MFKVNKCDCIRCFQQIFSDDKQEAFTLHIWTKTRIWSQKNASESLCLKKLNPVECGTTSKVESLYFDLKDGILIFSYGKLTKCGISLYRYNLVRVIRDWEKEKRFSKEIKPQLAQVKNNIKCIFN